MKIMQRLSLLAVAALLALSAVGCQQQANPALEQQRFDAFIEQEFIRAMESDYLTAHTYLQNPENFGVNRNNITVQLGARPDETPSEAAQQAEQAAARTFSSFNRNILTETQRDTYDTYAYQVALNEKLSNEKFDYYASYFESISGLQFQLPVLFADWQVRHEQDAQDLITLLNDTKPYVDSVLAYTKKQEELGLLAVDTDSVIKSCEKLLQAGENSAILAAMHSQLETLELPAETIQSYQQQVTQAFTQSFLPAFTAIQTAMEEFAQNGKNHTQGLAGLPNGKEYYALLLQKNSGSTRSVQEVKTAMENALRTHLSNVMTLAMTNPNVAQSLLSDNKEQTNYTSYTAMLDDLKSNISAQSPAINGLNYHITDMNPEIAPDSGISAYFVVPTLDGDGTQQLRVNPSINQMQALSTFSTVAHEGYPGHMYQYAYLYANGANNFMKTLAGNSAYVEGYAVYAQYEAMNYLKDLDTTFLQMYRENELATYCAIILADIGIHDEGWSLTEFQRFFEQMGFSLDETGLQQQYTQLQANPAAFIPYYVGYHTIADIKEQAQSTLGSTFDETAFHAALLQAGPAPFTVVQRSIDRYIEQARSERV